MRLFTGIASLLALSLLGTTIRGDTISDAAISTDDGEQGGVSSPGHAESIEGNSDMDILRFGTGDSLRGALLSIDSAQGAIRWKSPEARQEILSGSKRMNVSGTMLPAA